MTKEKAFFLTGDDPRLRPRGLMFDGEPGTGKTSAAKWIAEQFGVPLYRQDVGGAKGTATRRLASATCWRTSRGSTRPSPASS